MAKSPIKSKSKNKEREFALAYSVFNSKYYSENKSLLRTLGTLLDRGIEQTPALILSSMISNLWGPKQKYLIIAYDCFLKRGNSPEKSAFLAGSYMKNRVSFDPYSSLEDFEREFNQKEKSLLEMLG